MKFIILFAMLFCPLGFARPTRSQEKPTLGEVSCKADGDCVLVSHPCEGKEAYNKEFKKIAEERIERNSKFGSCPYVEYYIYQKKKTSNYEAKCSNKVCEAVVIKSKSSK